MSIHRAEWHVAKEDLAGYLSGDGRAVVTASIESHLLGCAACRGRLAQLDRVGRDLAWERLADTIDQPSRTLLGRLTRGNHLARSTIATPVMVRAALVAVALVGVIPFAVALLSGDAAPLAVLVLAPLAPVGAVALAYREWVDPAGEISLATPSAGLRLVAVRALLVSLSSLTLAVSGLLVADVWVDVPTRLVLGWCLPGLALAMVVLLAGTTRVDPLPLAVGLSVAWAGSLLAGASARRSLRYEVLVDVVAGPPVQTAAALLALAALTLTVVRRDAVSYRRVA